MRLVQLRLPLRAAVRPAAAAAASAASTAQPGLLSANAAVEGHRHASVKAQGAYKLKNKKTLPKKMGAKRVGDQYVLPGTILYKQRGTLWYAGENAILGRDHTIHAAVAGYVKYYRDPYQHPHRQYIGVTLDRSDALPHAPDAARKRRLGMVAVRRKTAPAPEPRTPGGLPRRVIRRAGVREAMDAAAEEPTRAAAAAAASEEAVQAAEDAAAASAPSATSPPAKGTGKGKETKAARAARRWNAYIRIKRSNRVLFVTKNYAYRESNVQIGQLMGRNNGTRRYGSRHAVLRHRRAKRDEALRQAKELMRQQRALAGDKTAKNAGGKKKTKAAKKDKAAKGKKKAA